MNASHLITKAQEIRPCFINRQTEVNTSLAMIVVDWASQSVIRYADSGIKIIGEISPEEIAKLNKFATV